MTMAPINLCQSDDDLPFAKRSYFIVGKSTFAQNGSGLIADILRSSNIHDAGIAEPRSSPRTRMISAQIECIARPHMGVMRRFLQCEYGRDAGVGSFKDRTPVRARARLEDCDHLRAERRPVFAVVLALHIFCVE